ncbi:MAG TPA: tRNA (N(6)-L-threonylcarbamoyladenosine(37)-C(2))-methylthiotransferase [Candidatus Nanoarchaeia archaeon]|nr:tRNA (N(6)-L-threonylcarbamoyladenosine(37)-C(2))-methylthiotransferase [Candidatus Nanoarchaeia archaeon]
MRIYIRTFGCTLNQSDSEVMSGLLSKAGHKLVGDVEEAELVLFNTCTVKDNPEKRFFSELEKVKNSGKRVVVAGCVPQAEPGNEMLKNVSVVGIRNLNRIVEAVEETAKGNIVRFLDVNNNPRLNLPKIRKNPVVEIIPLSSGCLGECSYCKTRFARGALFSYDVCAIKKQFAEAMRDGVKEVWLTSQDTGAYGKDIGKSLPELLDELLKVRGDYKIRLGMLNPNHALEFLDELVRIMKHPNMFKFVHLPVQSGSDKVLKLMNRKYSVKDFVKVVSKLRREIPLITIATDIICGFPGETEEDFEKTCKLLDELRIPVVNITKFCPRQGTPAARMKRISTRVVKVRTKKIVELQKKIIDNKNSENFWGEKSSGISHNHEWLGWEGEIIIDEIGKENSFVGRNEYYKPVVVKASGLKLGDVLKVRVIRAMQHYLEALPV